MAIVDRGELAEWLQRPVAERAADLAVRVAETWVRPRVKSVPWPPPHGTEARDAVWAAVLELAAMALDNPTAMRSSGTDGATDEWDVTARRDQILGDLEQRYGGAQPAGVFPTPAVWPDDASRRPW